MQFSANEHLQPHGAHYMCKSCFDYAYQLVAFFLKEKKGIKNDFLLTQFNFQDKIK